jgi:hypothetical protein
MNLPFPCADVELTEPTPVTTRISPLAAHHLDGIRTALSLGQSGEVRADVAMQRAAAELEKLALLLAGGGCYEAESVRPVVVLDDVSRILDDSAPVTAHERDSRESAA